MAPAPETSKAPCNAACVIPVAVILDRLRSAFNVGNIFRLAEASAIREVVTCGYTAAPPHPKLAKTARGCEERVNHRHFQTGAEAVAAMHAEGYHVYAVETLETSATIWDADIRCPAAFLLGNEALGVSAEALRMVDGAVRLPCFGWKNSVNVGNCAAVVLYEMRRRLSPDEAGSSDTGTVKPDSEE